MSDQEITDVVAWLAAQRSKPRASRIPRRRGPAARGVPTMSNDSQFQPPRLLTKIGHRSSTASWRRALAVPDRAVPPVAGHARARRAAICPGCRWVGLEQFPAGETRLATFRNPVRDADATARPPTSPAGCGASMASSSRSSPSIARTSAARSAGSRSPACSCVRATAAPTTATARARPDRRSAGCSSIPTRSRTASSPFKAGEAAHAGSPTASLRHGKPPCA